jgi:Tfp pilus assembly protein PilF
MSPHCKIHAAALCAALAAALVAGSASAQTPPPPPASATVVPQRTPGLTPELAEASRMMREGEYAAATAKIDAVLATDAKNPQARFLKGVVQTDQSNTEAAIATFQGLTEDYPELPAPYNNLAEIWAKQGQYEKARRALELALASRPDYAIAHENLGDIYARLASAEYDRAMALDKANKSAQTKLALVRELFAVPPSSTAPKPSPTVTQTDTSAPAACPRARSSVYLSRMLPDRYRAASPSKPTSEGVTDASSHRIHPCRRSALRRGRGAGPGRESAGGAGYHCGQDQDRALPRRGPEDGREFPRLRQSQDLRRHAVPSRDSEFHDSGRRV